MPRPGWQRLLEGSPWFRGAGAFPIAAYSELLPPPRYAVSPYGATGPSPFSADDPWGWNVTEHEEACELRPGLQQVADQIVAALVHLVRGESAEGLARSKRVDNPYWPPALAEHAGALRHERFVILTALALSRTRDDKGRDRWTLFGGSELGPARSFWRSFFLSPRQERPAEQGRAFLRRLLATAFGGPAERWDDLHRAGFRILPQGALAPPLPRWPEGTLPGWTGPLLWDEGQTVRGLKFLLTFRPFGALPEAVQQAYLAGKLHLLPFPGSLVFWGAATYLKLRRELPMAVQVPLLNLIERREAPHGLRVPQSGWLHEPRPDGVSVGDQHGPIRNAFRRTHRGEHTAMAGPAREDRVAHVLFDSSEAIGLYGKPIARNAQVWTGDGRLLLDGPTATRDALYRAAAVLQQGGLFGYRFQFPAMRVGLHEIYWHRPLVACLPEGAGQPVVIADAPLGHCISYSADQPQRGVALELWPRLLDREPYQAAETLFPHSVDSRPRQTAGNCRKLLDARAAWNGQPLPRSFAHRLLTLPESTTLDAWLDGLPARADDPARGLRLADELRRGLEAAPTPPPAALTFARTARRSFEVAYWNAIKALSGGRFPNRNNADCARDPVTRRALSHQRRDLDAVGDELLVRHAVAITAAGMKGRAFVGDLPFHWRTDFDFLWSDGWRANQGIPPRERDLIVVIPGRDRRRAIIVADHYDTAYMEDRYAKGTGPRLATPGADDNGSATAALLMAAPVLLELSRAGRLGCDVWLVHLTGEEFPADCLGARHLAQRLVEGNLTARRRNGRPHDLSATRVEGVYVLDMVAHDNPHRRGVFQIAPGNNRESMRLAYHAHCANESWNAAAPLWNAHPARRHAPRRGPTATALPPTARHPTMLGEVRPPGDPRSTLFNTDGQIFSDAGIPVVLLMEDYDIDRTGYHDSHDTMAGIDLDYGAALVAIAIEAVARAAGASA